MQLSVTNDPALTSAVTAAREAYNAALSETEDAPREDHEDFKASNDAYRDWVLGEWAARFASDAGRPPTDDEAQAIWDQAQASYAQVYRG